jgi:hypothetical protein
LSVVEIPHAVGFGERNFARKEPLLEVNESCKQRQTFGQKAWCRAIEIRIAIAEIDALILDCAKPLPFRF